MWVYSSRASLFLSTSHPLDLLVWFWLHALYVCVHYLLVWSLKKRKLEYLILIRKWGVWVCVQYGRFTRALCPFLRTPCSSSVRALLCRARELRLRISLLWVGWAREKAKEEFDRLEKDWWQLRSLAILLRVSLPSPVQSLRLEIEWWIKRKWVLALSREGMTYKRLDLHHWICKGEDWQGKGVFDLVVALHSLDQNRIYFTTRSECSAILFDWNVLVSLAPSGERMHLKRVT